MEKLQELLLINMKKARQELGYSQMRLAELCNLSTGFIADIETGKKFPSASSLQKIATALGMKPYQLFVDQEDIGLLEKHDLLTNLYKELKDRINSDLEEVIKRYQLR